jgi:SAM-dependent methyltransferase
MRKIITGTQSLPPASADQPLSAPAAERNIEPILGVLRLVVEIASGTGQHCARFAAEFPGVTWSPTDPSPERLVSISAWAAASGQANIQRPIALDAGEPGWPFEAVSLDGLVAINLLHIAGDHVATQVFASAGQLLKPMAPSPATASLCQRATAPFTSSWSVWTPPSATKTCARWKPWRPRTAWRSKSVMTCPPTTCCL